MIFSLSWFLFWLACFLLSLCGQLRFSDWCLFSHWLALYSLLSTELHLFVEFFSRTFRFRFASFSSTSSALRCAPWSLKDIVRYERRLNWFRQFDLSSFICFCPPPPRFSISVSPLFLLPFFLPLAFALFIFINVSVRFPSVFLVVSPGYVTALPYTKKYWYSLSAYFCTFSAAYIDTVVVKSKTKLEMETWVDN